jgi:putative molybdopterin biosynthesis protein
MHIKVIPKWGFENEKGQSLHDNLLPLLDGINRTGRLTQAAKGVGISYRHAWNLLRDSEVFFGSPLVILEKGRGATLLPLGMKLLRSNQRIEARLHPEAESLSSELNVELQNILASDEPVVRIFASHGYAVAAMTEFTRYSQVEMHYHSPEHALIALNEGRCRIAGFHQAINLEIPAQKARYRELLDPSRFGIIRFVRRQQGLIFADDNPFAISRISDLGKGGFRFINRQDTSGTRVLLEQLLKNQHIDFSKIDGYSDQEFTHSAVAAHIASGMADVGFGVEAAARRFNLGFAPIAQEYYLWAYPLVAEHDPDIQAFISTLADSEFQIVVNKLPGYECDRSGEVISADSLI